MTVPSIVAYRLMIKMCHARRFVDLGHAKVAQDLPMKEMQKFVPHITPEVLRLIAAHWPQFWSDFVEGGLFEVAARWSLRLGVTRDPEVN